MSKCMEGIWRYKMRGKWFESYHTAAEIRKHYTNPCSDCGADVVRLSSYDAKLCRACILGYRKAYREKQLEARRRVRFRAFKKQLAEIGQLLTTARKLIHENNEPAPRHSV